ncbi:MAG: DUF429 domain-containing protein [Opitutaceae bacterium]|nr:DUF429 domain-containing protein [Opitutaceae bacterium]
MLLIGLDLAWGEKNSDGVCLIRYARRRAHVLGYAYPHGDVSLIAALGSHLQPDEPAFAAIDAPIVCPNPTGARPVDRLTPIRSFTANTLPATPPTSRNAPARRASWRASRPIWAL